MIFFPERGFYNWTDYIALFIAFGIGAIPAQEIYQRVFSAKSEKAGKDGVILSAFLLFFVGAIPLIIGLGAAKLHPELMGSDHGQNLIPAMVSQYMSLPVQMLFFGALISAILSTSWFVCDWLETRIDPTIFGLLSSCIAMFIGSLLRPNQKIL